MAIARKRILFGVLALFFITLSLFLLRLGLRQKWDHRDYWIGIIGFCILLELFYVSLHFSLKTLLFPRHDLVTASTRAVAAIIAIPVTIMAFLSCVIVGGAMIRTGTETIAYLEDLGFILALLGLPAFFLWRHALRTFKRTEQTVGPGCGDRAS